MSIEPMPGEPSAEPWRVIAWSELVDLIASHLATSLRERRVLAVDGRSGAGKTTLAHRLAHELSAAVVGIDDLSWHHSMFDWADLLRSGVLAPFRAVGAVDLRPPAWETRGRPGSVLVPAGTTTLVLEGVGAGRREVGPLVDTLIWVQSDHREAERLGIARDIQSGVNGDAEASHSFWRTWMGEEMPFLEHDRPWERADLIVAGTSLLDLPVGEVAVSSAPGRGARST